MATNPVIVLEFNELTPSLIDRFVDEGHLPNFAKFRAESDVYTTMAEEREPYLEPWIQWVTVHTGLPYAEHNVFHLNEGHKVQVKRTWELLSDAGRRVWVCGSMNVGSAASTNAWVLPDPWCTKVKPTPEELSLYFKFVQQNVLEHTNERRSLSAAEYFKFLWFMARHGLSATTINAITRQLASERRSGDRWKRVVLLDLLQFDVFRHYYRRLSPGFSTFFLNSTAHYQHAYWDSMSPEQFVLAPDAEKTQYRDAIRFGYQRMDRLLSRFMSLASASNATIVFCTALSQQPSPDYPKGDGALFYRPKSFTELAKAVNLVGTHTVQPVMSEQFHLEFASAEQAQAAANQLGALRVDGAKVMAVELRGTRIFTGCYLHEAISENATLSVDGRSIPFFDLFYMMDTGKTGVHHPDGILWIRKPDRRHQTTAERIPLTAVAPTLLSLSGLRTPDYMRTPPLPVV